MLSSEDDASIYSLSPGSPKLGLPSQRQATTVGAAGARESILQAPSAYFPAPDRCGNRRIAGAVATSVLRARSEPGREPSHLESSREAT
jgi:hypothetical protein